MSLRAVIVGSGAGASGVLSQIPPNVSVDVVDTVRLKDRQCGVYGS